MKLHLALLPAICVAGFATSSLAASEDAWEEFRADVATACRAALELPDESSILVEPFGSEHYGFALAVGEDGPMVCVYDKQTQQTEVGLQFEQQPS